MNYYLLAHDYTTGEEFWLQLESTTLDEAEHEAKMLMVESAIEGDTEFDYRNYEEFIVVESSAEREISEFDCDDLMLSLEHRKADAVASWTEQYELLRDEVGHWRHLHARGQAPHAQVALLEDRLSAHLAAKP